MISLGDTLDSKRIINQTIVYKTGKAREVYIVWAMDNWKIPDKKYQPPGTYINNNMAFSKMNKDAEGFRIELKLPAKIYVDCMFWASKDLAGNVSDSWDTNWGSSYDFYFDGKNPIKTVNDEKLQMVAPQGKPFDLLEKGRWVFLISLIIFLGGLIPLLLKRKGDLLSVTRILTGTFISCLLLMLLIRLQLNDLLSHHQYYFAGVFFSDLNFILLIGCLGGMLVMVTRKIKWLNRLICYFLIAIILSSAFFSMLNVEIVRQIGKPLTYNWLYYSDFLQSNDAKNAIKSGLNPDLIKNITLIMISLCLAAAGIALVSKNFRLSKRTVAGLLIFICLIYGLGYYQYRTGKFNKGKVDNPVTLLFISWINALHQPELFSENVSAETRKIIENMHSGGKADSTITPNQISNVVIFVLESTPANIVYDSNFNVTPNIHKWKTKARLYNKMYAHLPTTVNTMLSIVSGIYPLISYKSLVNEYPSLKIPSLPALLQQARWKTSAFLSSDLSYSHIGDYLKAQQVEHAEDFKTINCDQKKFNSNYSQLDGLDDRCMVKSYFKWRESVVANTFSVLWTNQTHYPYFFSGEENKYTENKELNKYLNGLEETDLAFGEFMDGLEKRNQLDNTLVILVGDHGEAFGTHNQYTHGANIYEENMRVPCLLINPFLFHGETDTSIRAMIDIAPTIMHLLGLKQPAEWEGSSMLSPDKRDHTFFIGPYSDFQFGSRFQNWKLIYNAADDTYKLFDVIKDPGEINNLADENPALIKKEFEIIAGWVQYHQKKLQPFLK